MPKLTDNGENARCLMAAKVIRQASMRSFLSKAPLMWGVLVIIVSVGVFLYLIQGDKSVSQTLIPASYYSDSQETAEAIHKKLANEIKQNQFYWLGLEPEKNEQVELFSELIKKIKNEKKIEKIIVDEELALSSKQLKELEATDVIPVKENLYLVGEKLQELEKNSTGYLLVTASIYTSSLLKKNPGEILKQNYNLRPLVISSAYFSSDTKDEINFLFPCNTEDHTGTSDWGCFILNKSRFARRKLISQKKPWVALVDAVNSTDFILLTKRNY